MTATIIQRKSGRAILAAALALSMSACSTPEAVQQFTASAKDAAAQLPPLVRDMTASCIRKQLADRSPGEIADRDALAADSCKELAAQEPNVLNALTILTAYLNSLNQLASNKTVSFDEEIDGLAGKIQSAGKFGAPQVNAVQGLAKFLADAAASGFQRKKLGDALKRADGDIATLMTALETIIGSDYDRLLRTEEESVLSRYRDVVAPEKSLATQLLIQDRWRTDLAAIKAKQAAAKDAQSALMKISSGHHALAQQVDRWDAAQLYKILNPYASSIQTLVADFKAAY